MAVSIVTPDRAAAPLFEALTAGASAPLNARQQAFIIAAMFTTDADRAVDEVRRIEAAAERRGYLAACAAIERAYQPLRPRGARKTKGQRA